MKKGVLVRGMGINDAVNLTAVMGKNTKEYSLWADMLLRCTESYWEKKPTYIGTTCSENFKSYSFFYNWCQEQVGFGNRDEKGKLWHLDKDLLVKDNKHYSEDTCCFVPCLLNNITLSRGKDRGKYAVGVHWDKEKSKFVASCRNGNRSSFIGRFNTEKEAFIAYKNFKEGYVKKVAEDYKDRIDPRTYRVLMTYQVEVTS